MSTVDVTDIGDDRFGVVIEEGHVRTAHVLSVPAALPDEPEFADVDRAVLVRESVGFLLDRQPATAIADELSIDDIAASYPDYHDEIRARLGAP